jgi:WD40 repeat protein
VIWDSQPASPRRRFVTDEGIHNAVLAPDGRRLVLLGDGGASNLVDLSGSNDLDRGALLPFGGISARFSPDGRRLGVVQATGNVLLWDIDAGRLIDTRGPMEGSEYGIDFDREGGRLVTTGEGTNPEVFDLKNAQRSRGPSLDGEILALDIDGRTDRAAIATATGSVFLWTLGAAEPQFLFSQREAIRAEFDRTGRFLVVSSFTGMVSITPLMDPRMRIQIAVEGLVKGFAVSPDSRFLVILGPDFHASAYDLQTGVLVRNLATEGELLSAAFSPSGDYLITGGQDLRLRIWRVRDWTEVIRFPVRYQVFNAGFLEGERYVFAVDGNDTLKTWPWQAQELIELVCSRRLRPWTQEEWTRFVGPESPARDVCEDLR